MRMLGSCQPVFPTSISIGVKTTLSTNLTCSGIVILVCPNKTSYSRILEFVRSFSRSKVVSEDGNLVLDSRGNQVTMPRVIDTRSLVFSSDPKELLGRFSLLPFVSI